jgi:hypothetical protein
MKVAGIRKILSEINPKNIKTGGENRERFSPPVSLFGTY